MTKTMTFSEEEREIIMSGLDVIDPDSEEGHESLDALTQRFLPAVEEGGDVDFELNEGKIALLKDAVQILEPEDDDVDALKDRLETRLLVALGYSDEDPDGP